MTPEQLQAIAIASARARAAAATHQGPGSTQQSAPEGFERAGAGAYAGSPFAGGPLDLIPEAAQSGMADAVIRGGMGIKNLFTKLSSQDQEVLKAQKEEQQADPEWAKRIAGNIGANIAATAVPMAPVARGLTAASKALPAFLAPVAVGAGVSGAQGAVLNPGEGETWTEQMGSKLKSAGVDAVFGGALGGAGALLKKTLTQMFRPNHEAEKLFEQGTNPTLQQGAESRVGKFIGGLTSGSAPIRARQEQEVETTLANRIAPGAGDLANKTRKEVVNIADELLGKEYEGLFSGKTFRITKQLRADVDAAARSQLTKTNQFMEETRNAQRAVGNIMGEAQVDTLGRTIPDKVTAKGMQERYLTAFSQAAAAAKTEREKTAILAARDVIRDARNAKLSSEELAVLKNLDVRNYDLSRLKEAAKGPGGEKEGVSLAKLEAAYSRAKPMAGNTTADDLIGPATRKLGVMPRQDMERTFLSNLKRAGLLGSASYFAGPVTTVPLAAAYGTSMIGQTAGGAKALMGQFPAQKALAEYMRKAAPYTAGAGQSLTGEE